MPSMHLAALSTAVLFAIGVPAGAVAAPPKVDSPPVPDRCLAGLKRKQVSAVHAAALSPTESVVLIDLPVIEVDARSTMGQR